MFGFFGMSFAQIRVLVYAVDAPRLPTGNLSPTPIAQSSFTSRVSSLSFSLSISVKALLTQPFIRECKLRAMVTDAIIPLSLVKEFVSRHCNSSNNVSTCLKPAVLPHSK